MKCTYVNSSTVSTRNVFFIYRMEKLIENKEAEKKELETSSLQSSCSNKLDSDIIEVFQEIEKSTSDNVFVVERVVNGSVSTVKSSRPSFSSETEDIPSKHTSVSVTSGESSEKIQAAKRGVEIVKEIAGDFSQEPGITPMSLKSTLSDINYLCVIMQKFVMIFE